MARPTLLPEMRAFRQKRLAEASIARRRHRDVAKASRRAIEATSLLLKAEIALRRTGKSKTAPGPDLFQDAA